MYVCVYDTLTVFTQWPFQGSAESIGLPPFLKSAHMSMYTHTHRAAIWAHNTQTELKTRALASDHLYLPTPWYYIYGQELNLSEFVSASLKWGFPEGWDTVYKVLCIEPHNG